MFQISSDQTLFLTTISVSMRLHCSSLSSRISMWCLAHCFLMSGKGDFVVRVARCTVTKAPYNEKSLPEFFLLSF